MIRVVGHALSGCLVILAGCLVLMCVLSLAAIGTPASTPLNELRFNTQRATGVLAKRQLRPLLVITLGVASMRGLWVAVEILV